MSDTKNEWQQGLPSNHTMSKIMAVCANKSAALMYWRDDLIQVVKKCRAGDQFKDILEALDNTIAVAKYQEEKAAAVDEWGGKIQDIAMLKADTINQLDFMAQNEYQTLDETQKAQLMDVTLIYDISDKGEFLRGYLSNGKPLVSNSKDDQKIISVMDKAFHSWLIHHNMLSKDGILYKNNPVDNAGNPIEIVTSDTLDLLLNDEKMGLDESAKKLDKDLVVVVIRQEKPAPALAQSQPDDDNRFVGN